MALAAQWVQRSEVTACLTELCDVIIDEKSSVPTTQLCRQESHLECQLLGEKTVSKDEIIASTRNLAALASLYHSVVCARCSVPNQFLILESARHGLQQSWTS